MSSTTKAIYWLFLASATALYGQSVSTSAPPQTCDASKPWGWLFNFPDNGQAGSFIKIDAKTLSLTSETNFNPQFRAFAPAVSQYLLSKEVKLKGQRAGKLIVWRNCSTNEIKHEFAAPGKDIKEWKPQVQVAKAAAKPTKDEKKAAIKATGCDASKEVLAYRFPMGDQSGPMVVSAETLSDPANIAADQEAWFEKIKIGLLSTGMDGAAVKTLTVCRNTKTSEARVNLEQPEGPATVSVSKKRAIIGMALGSAPSLLAFVNPKLAYIGMVSGPLVSWLMSRGSGGSVHNEVITGKVQILPYYTGMPDPQGISQTAWLRDRAQRW